MPRTDPCVPKARRFSTRPHRPQTAILALCICMAGGSSGVPDDTPTGAKTIGTRPYVPPDWAVTFSHVRSAPGSYGRRDGTVHADGAAKLEESYKERGEIREEKYNRQLTEKERLRVLNRTLHALAAFRFRDIDWLDHANDDEFVLRAGSASVWITDLDGGIPEKAAARETFNLAKNPNPIWMALKSIAGSAGADVDEAGAAQRLRTSEKPLLAKGGPEQWTLSLAVTGWDADFPDELELDYKGHLLVGKARSKLRGRLELEKWDLALNEKDRDSILNLGAKAIEEFAFAMPRKDEPEDRTTRIKARLKLTTNAGDGLREDYGIEVEETDLDNNKPFKAGVVKLIDELKTHVPRASQK
jgi:hypothetical protein